jgi:aspartate/methionine/tyrosine aminotransferase
VSELAAARARGAARVGHFTESVIREMTRLADDHGAINLAQGFPDFDTPEEIKEAARRAITSGVNQYPVTWGTPRFREAIAAKYGRFGWPEPDPDEEIVVTCGSTEAMAAAFLGLMDPGDEVIVFEPFYENYGPDAYMAGAVPVVVPLDPPAWTVDMDRLEAATTVRTRAIVITTPHNPTGKVFSSDELAAIAEIAIERDLLVFTDEIYEHIVYDGREHLSMALVPGMAERTVTISAMSKTYAVTGWRVGWAIAAPPLMSSIRKIHDFLTVAAPAPLQEAGITAMEMADEFYRELASDYHQRRDLFLSLVGEAYDLIRPEGAYYAMARVGPLRGRLGLEDDTALCHALVTQAGVAAVPGSSFFVDGARGSDLIRFAFPKRLETLREAGSRLAQFAAS